MRVLLFLLFIHAALAQTTSTNRIPPPGIPIPPDVAKSLTAELRQFQTELQTLRTKPLDDQSIPLLADVEVYEKAVRYALDYNEFHRTNEFTFASKLIAEGRRRAESLSHEKSVWLENTNLLVRGYRSRVDQSYQPYGIVVPKGYRPGDGKTYRLDIWLHGRDENLTELKFIADRTRSAGEFTPPDTFVLHPYGRYCNAFKFAGETDVLEALEAVQLVYPIDPHRVVMRGFSMGGAGVWHLATHYADKWVCASPGAGFAESAHYLRLKVDSVPAYERKLWGWYDATDYAANLFNCPVVAYSGELDKQKQAADIMAEALAKEGLPLIHLIGPKTEHKYEPQTKLVVAAAVDTFARMRQHELPREVRLTTKTLRYPQMHWLTLVGLQKHWERSDAWARIWNNDRVQISLTNVTAFALDFQVYPHLKIREVEINGSTLKVPKGHGEGLLVFTLKTNQWQLALLQSALAKQPHLQGPIDDAFTDSFVFVTPSEAPLHPQTGEWVKKEFDRATFEWRSQFRGDVQQVSDSELTNLQIERSNLILWGDPQSNLILQRILARLPLKWSKEKLEFGGKSFDPATHLPLLIFPNPLNPEKYIVLNSCFTFRGFGSNAAQIPKLPDYALLDITQPDPFKTGIVAAGFFNENWAVGE